MGRILLLNAIIKHTNLDTADRNMNQKQNQANRIPTQILHQKAEQTFLHFDICMLLYGLAVAM
uniref:Uncharacterized protein n=1 Tax=Cairina moschata TaxID=8855 RepID=A0A8C3GG25_CAIMO